MLDLTLTDSSVWVDFFRGEPAALKRLDPLLAERVARVSGPIVAELLSGATNAARQNEIRMLFSDIAWLKPSEPIWLRVGETRFVLARQGQRSNILDVLIALTAFDCGAKLLTRDRDFERIAKVVPLDLEVF